ncbi:hypothetical protein EHW97_13365 [Aeromicrobium camelliae]|uniref:Uncharacterized protein n=2 Tax=Aeromicrobium TaxID=2040 RepID=A0A3N6W4C9_9ACTN|nr:DUF6049 family protein [Aeromicrobium camelliae]RQN02389.1 hypothetical protein EHW97_13365 [Aeromicrobium camelliae]
MTSRRIRLRGLLLAVGAAMVWMVLGGVAAAEEKSDQGGLTVTIDALSPARLDPDATIQLSGTIENTGTSEWTAVQAYLVMARSPFTTRDQVEAVATDDTTYIGDRIITPGLFDEVGDLEPGESASFDLEVPLAEVGVTGAQGVYPVGVQLLATDAEGTRSDRSVARATTFLPWVEDPSDPVPSGLVWSFTLGPHREDAADDVEALRDAISDGGRMRQQLDLAASLPTSSRTLVIDPAVLDAAQNLADDTGIPEAADIEDDDRRAADSFREDLIALARSSATWIVDYDRPDRVALVNRPDLEATIAPQLEAATTDALSRHQLTGRRAHWAAETGATTGLMNSLRSAGESPTIVRSSSLPDWEQRHGSLVTVETRSGPAPLAVNDTLRAGDGTETTVTLRQRVLVQAALASLSRAVDPQSRADALTFVDPSWVPDEDARATTLLPALGDDDLTHAVTLDELLAGGVDGYDEELPDQPLTAPLPSPVLSAVEQLQQAQTMAAAAVTGQQDQESVLARQLAGALSVRWLDQPERAAVSATQQADQITESLDGIEVLGPRAVTLSSSQGSFPLTISNPTTLPISVSIALDASNPALDPEALPPVDIAPGERKTVNADIDLGRQTSTTLTAQAMAGETPIGRPAEFNVRSSQVGVIVWLAMGAAALGVIVAMGRRFSRRGFRRLSDDAASKASADE